MCMNLLDEVHIFHVLITCAETFLSVLHLTVTLIAEYGGDSTACRLLHQFLLIDPKLGKNIEEIQM